MLVLDTPVSRSLGATFSEFTGQPTSLELHVPAPSIVAPITGITEMLPSTITSSEPPASVIPVESWATPVPDLTQIASALVPAIEG